MATVRKELHGSGDNSRKEQSENRIPSGHEKKLSTDPKQRYFKGTKKGAFAETKNKPPLELNAISTDLKYQDSIADSQKRSSESKRHSKQHKKGHEKVHQIERRSLIDVINYALQQTDRITYLHRLIYIGQHSFKDSGEGSEELDSMFQTSVNLVNEDYCSEPITGCFIFYSKYFIHIVEGSEDSIGHHVQLIVEQIEQCGNLVGTVKIILQSHHIRRRYFGAWFSMYGVPRTLIDKISGDNETEMRRRLENFHKKIVDIASYLEKRDTETEQGVGNNLNQKTLALLPEITLLEFLLKIDCLETLHDFLNTYQHFPHLKIYQDYCWPPVMEFVPYNLYHELPTLSKLDVPEYHPKEEIEVESRAEEAKAREEAKMKRKESMKDPSKSLLDVFRASSVSEVNIS